MDFLYRTATLASNIRGFTVFYFPRKVTAAYMATLTFADTDDVYDIIVL